MQDGDHQLLRGERDVDRDLMKSPYALPYNLFPNADKASKSEKRGRLLANAVRNLPNAKQIELLHSLSQLESDLKTLPSANPSYYPGIGHVGSHSQSNIGHMSGSVYGGSSVSSLKTYSASGDDWEDASSVSMLSLSSLGMEEKKYGVLQVPARKAENRRVMIKCLCRIGKALETSDMRRELMRESVDIVGVTELRERINSRLHLLLTTRETELLMKHFDTANRGEINIYDLLGAAHLNYDKLRRLKKKRTDAEKLGWERRLLLQQREEFRVKCEIEKTKDDSILTALLDILAEASYKLLSSKNVDVLATSRRLIMNSTLFQELLLDYGIDITLRERKLLEQRYSPHNPPRTGTVDFMLFRNEFISLGAELMVQRRKSDALQSFLTSITIAGANMQSPHAHGKLPPLNAQDALNSEQDSQVKPVEAVAGVAAAESDAQVKKTDGPKLQEVFNAAGKKSKPKNFRKKMPNRLGPMAADRGVRLKPIQQPRIDGNKSSIVNSDGKISTGIASVAAESPQKPTEQKESDDVLSPLVPASVIDQNRRLSNANMRRGSKPLLLEAAAGNSGHGAGAGSHDISAQSSIHSRRSSTMSAASEDSADESATPPRGSMNSIGDSPTKPQKLRRFSNRRVSEVIREAHKVNALSTVVREKSTNMAVALTEPHSFTSSIAILNMMNYRPDGMEFAESSTYQRRSSIPKGTRSTRKTMERLQSRKSMEKLKRRSKEKHPSLDAKLSEALAQAAASAAVPAVTLKKSSFHKKGDDVGSGSTLDHKSTHSDTAGDPNVAEKEGKSKLTDTDGSGSTERSPLQATDDGSFVLSSSDASESASGSDSMFTSENVSLSNSVKREDIIKSLKADPEAPIHPEEKEVAAGVAESSETAPVPDPAEVTNAAEAATIPEIQAQEDVAAETETPADKGAETGVTTAAETAAVEKAVIEDEESVAALPPKRPDDVSDTAEEVEDNVGFNAKNAAIGHESSET